ncbi:hypothetical protein D3C87_465970 [compost metagenome]
MQCPCGGSTKVVKNERRKNNVLSVLSYNECVACSRVGEIDLHEINPDTGKSELITSGPPGSYWDKYGF